MAKRAEPTVEERRSALAASHEYAARIAKDPAKVARLRNRAPGEHTPMSKAEFRKKYGLGA